MMRLFANMKMFHMALVLITSLFAIQVASHRIATHDETFVPDATLRVTLANVSQPCVPMKEVALVNGTTPGPPLYLEEGKTTWIRVYNDMATMNLTMHWHGLTMAVSPFSDGTPLASQWPIPPMHFFDYEINIPPGMAGTYYYHSHVGFQAVSVNGPLIIKDIVPPYEYDEERIIMFNDVFDVTMETIEANVLKGPAVLSETSNILINGKGAGVSSGVSCNSSLSIIDVEPDKTYRLRFIGGTALTFSSFAIEDHDLTIIEADGSYTKPVKVDFMQLTVGQRFSALLKTKTKDRVKSGQFFMQVENRERAFNTTSYAVLSYGARHTEDVYPPVQSPLSLPPTDQTWLEYTLEPLFDNHFPTLKEVTRRVHIDVQQVVRNITQYYLNNVTWTSSVPQEPYLVSLYKNDGIEYPSMERALQHRGVDPVTQAWPAEIGEVLEIVLENLCDGSGTTIGKFDTHPFHSHGKHFYDIGSGNGTYNLTENEEKLRGYHPVQRDVTPLFRYATEGVPGTKMGWRAWRLRVQAPGVWLIHCHVEEHMLMGMQMVWVFGNSTEVLKLPIDDVAGYLTYGGNVNGNTTHWPRVVEYSTSYRDK